MAIDHYFVHVLRSRALLEQAPEDALLCESW